MNRHKLISRIILYLIFVLFVFLLLKSTGLKVADLSPEMILSLAHDRLFIVLLMMLFIMILQNLFTFIPLILVITINISLFGFWPGYLYSTCCSVVGSTLIFLTIRYVFPNSFANTSFKKYEEKIKKNGFRFVLFGRILPFLPTNLINIVSGLSSIKLTHFISATTIGNLVYGLILSTASFSLLAALKTHPYYATLPLIAVLIIYVLLLNRKRRKKMLA